MKVCTTAIIQTLNYKGSKDVTLLDNSPDQNRVGQLFLSEKQMKMEDPANQIPHTNSTHAKSTAALPTEAYQGPQALCSSVSLQQILPSHGFPVLFHQTLNPTHCPYSVLRLSPVAQALEEAEEEKKTTLASPLESVMISSHPGSLLFLPFPMSHPHLTHLLPLPYL